MRVPTAEVVAPTASEVTETALVTEQETQPPPVILLPDTVSELDTALLEPAGKSAFKSFIEHVNGLGLHEFPCGFGEWRRGTVGANGLGNSVEDDSFVVTTKDVGVNKIQTQDLVEYITRKDSPWVQNNNWSPEADELRRLAVKQPWLLNFKLILNHFKTLRLDGVGITTLGEPNELKKLRNLETLCLSANFLAHVDGAHLPRNIQILELCGNQLTDASSLLHDPPTTLIHLGLSRNQLCDVPAAFPPSLLLLDLSFNHLEDIEQVCGILKQQKALRCLLLKGNPLSLTPGYRGYIVDNIPQLKILDDVDISADERHWNKKMPLFSEAILVFQVPVIKNIVTPLEVTAPEDYPEYPKMERTYHVEISLPLPARRFFDEENELAITTRSESAFITEVNTPEPDIEKLEDEEQPIPEVPPLEPVEIVVKTPAGSPLVETGKTAGSWADTLPLNWVITKNFANVRAVRDFLLDGATVSVVESFRLGWTPELYPGSPDLSGKSSRSPRGKKTPPAPPKEKGKPAASASKKKKGKEELKYHPTDRTVLATWKLDLASLMEEQNEVEDIFSAEAETIKLRPPTAGTSRKLKRGVSPGDKKKREKSPKAKDKKDKKKAPVVEEELTPKPPMEVSVKLRMITFATTAEAKKYQTEYALTAPTLQ